MIVFVFCIYDIKPQTIFSESTGVECSFRCGLVQENAMTFDNTESEVKSFYCSGKK